MRPHLVALLSESGRRALVLATLLVVTYMAALIAAKAWETYATQQEAARLRVDIDRLQERYTHLEALRDYELTDDFVEQIARRQLNLIKPGETAVVVIAPPAIAPDPPPAPASPRPWWRSAMARLLPQTP